MNKLLTLDVNARVLIAHIWTNLGEFRRFYLGVEKMVGYEHLGLLGLFVVLAALVLRTVLAVEMDRLAASL